MRDRNNPPGLVGTGRSAEEKLNDTNGGPSTPLPADVNARLLNIFRRIGPAVLLPITPGQKKPVFPGWSKFTLDTMQEPAYMAEFTHERNIGVALGKPSNGLCSIDFDVDEEAERFLALNPKLAVSLRTTRKRGCNVWVRIKGDYPKLYKLCDRDRTTPAGQPLQLGEWRSTGGQTVIDGTAEGVPYRKLVDAPPVEIAFDEIQWPDNFMLPWRNENPSKANGGAKPEADLEKLIVGGAPKGMRNDSAFQLACRLRNAGTPQAGAKLLVRQFGANCNPALTQAECDTVIASAFKGVEQSETPNLIDRLTARLFNPAVKPTEQEPRYYISNVPVATAGNLGAISAPPKQCKSAVIGACMASTFALDGADCFSIHSSNPEGKAVLHLDTEQSIEDHWDLLNRTITRAGADLPQWLRSYCVTGFSIKEAQLAVSLLMAECAEKFGGIHSVFLDGVADLVCDVNDPEESNLFVNHLHSLAIQYACPIIGVIHLNPGSEKTRGHLGSQLERKAETNLRIEKDGDAFVLWSDKNRRAPIPKATGPRFAWSDIHEMHVSVESAGDVKRAELRDEYTPMVEEIFRESKAHTYTTMVQKLVVLGIKSPTTQKRRLREWDQIGLITKTPQGLYVRAA